MSTWQTIKNPGHPPFFKKFFATPPPPSLFLFLFFCFLTFCYIFLFYSNFSYNHLCRRLNTKLLCGRRINFFKSSKTWKWRSMICRKRGRQNFVTAGWKASTLVPKSLRCIKVSPYRYLALYEANQFFSFFSFNFQPVERSQEKNSETERLKQLVTENWSLKERTSELQNQLTRLLEKLKTEKEKVRVLVFASLVCFVLVCFYQWYPIYWKNLNATNTNMF